MSWRWRGWCRWSSRKGGDWFGVATSDWSSILFAEFQVWELCWRVWDLFVCFANVWASLLMRRCQTPDCPLQFWWQPIRIPDIHILPHPSIHDKEQRFDTWQSHCSLSRQNSRRGISVSGFPGSTWRLSITLTYFTSGLDPLLLLHPFLWYDGWQ